MPPQPPHPEYQFITRQGMYGDGNQLWRAQVRDAEGKNRKGGRWPDPHKAARQADDLLVRIWGNEKPLNLPAEMTAERRAELAGLTIDELVQSLSNGLVFSRGKSAYRGVSYFSQTDAWRARIHVDGKVKALGSFDHTDDGELEAAVAYDVAARSYFDPAWPPLHGPESAPEPASSARTSTKGRVATSPWPEAPAGPAAALAAGPGAGGGAPAAARRAAAAYTARQPPGRGSPVEAPASGPDSGPKSGGAAIAGFTT
ncbi:AP2-like ethylene-responsive transcription factor AIL5 [Tetrabaena socialis]|uniref:AP2-like ethylene-responsive transcription factor AIL5 n=1 Tax=Tetrabaena socialis TaxID=47790 RepID=A0A2J7ZI69_9CHLO|nr:AP2-like ethylene-responsive transcription factor AIL5 [Tetrabaena socialis]|eukprot:PNG99970.1 AP2-like ethylene-responsive transcription factor AIL5 [Tetrabaena socialis]